jgi:hypothetical protein
VVRRLHRTFSTSIGILMAKDDVSRVASEPFAQANVFSSAKALLDKIKATAVSPPAPSSGPTPLKPVVSLAR